MRGVRCKPPPLQVNRAFQLELAAKASAVNFSQVRGSRLAGHEEESWCWRALWHPAPLCSPVLGCPPHSCYRSWPAQHRMAKHPFASFLRFALQVIFAYFLGTA